MSNHAVQAIWVPSVEVAFLVGLSEQRLRALCKSAISQPTKWHGVPFVARQVHGRGGRGGWQYEVRADSLPFDLQEQVRSQLEPSQRALTRHGSKAQIERSWWYSLISPALAHPHGSRERGATIKDIVSRQHIAVNGRLITVSERSVQRKIASYEQDAVAGLGRRKRADAGQSRVILSARWDKAVPFDDGTKERIAHEIRQYVRGLVKNGEAGEPLKMLVNHKLADMTRQAGFDDPALMEICRVPANLLWNERNYKRVHRFKSDRKAYEDAKPRVRRSRDGMLPMDIIVADVHPVDILVRRADGSTATPRAIGWLDVATNRIWLDLVLLEKGEGIRNAHVIASFVRMVMAWGAPRHLYLDNGSEYNWADFIDDALKLTKRGFLGTVDYSERASSITRAQPYNASAKPIEGVFATLERNHFSRIPGWIGGDRMRSKTANVGRAPVAFPNSFDDLRVLIAAAVEMYHATPQRGSLKNRAPFQAYANAVMQGWGMTAIDPDALRIVFSTEKLREVRQGAISHGGQRWTCPELQAYQGRKVVALIPKYDDWARLPVLDERGNVLGFAEPDAGYGFLDSHGAREAKERDKTHRRAVRQLDISAPDINPLEERIKLLSTLPPAPVAPVTATISQSDRAAKIAAGLHEPATHKRERELQRISEENRVQLDLAKRFIRTGTEG